MSRVCQITGKKKSMGNNRSHACNATKRSFKPNIQVQKVYDPKTGRTVKMKLSTRALRTMIKKGNKMA
ncbi:50S ribosomal protein L28 [Candidatus Peregrinibacteria bacterium]|nr:50S ribosomal protein L28 [Candidatus Peregrinibacteria bacterium]